MRPNVISNQFAAAAVGGCLALLLSAPRAASQSIVITNIPALGAYGNLSGYVTNASFTTNCVAVFIYVAGGWYSKPTCSSQLTPINPDGSWTVNVTTSSSDTNATEIAAFLVPVNYDQSCADGTNGLAIPSQAEAVAYVDRVSSSARQFTFSGYGWSVKTSGGSLAGPGPNYFSDSTNNVWVDTQGLLHLKITYTNGEWQCAEIISDQSFGYGQYRFTVNTPVSILGTNVVLGMFTYSYDAAYNDREIDIEQSHWEYAYGPNDVEDYAIAPYGTGQETNFFLPAGVTNSTHSFIWQSTNIAFQSLNGYFASPPAASNMLANWSCSAGIPPAGGEQVHINLWLDNGNPPANNQPVEVTLSQFDFVPLGSPPPARLNDLNKLPDGDIQLRVAGADDWHYQIFSSSNLSQWLELGTVLVTNTPFFFTDTNPASLNPRFYRALTEP
jgi:hypothetical protein